MKKRVSLVFAAVLAMMLMIAGCQKEEEVAQVAAPSPEFVAWSESGLEDHVMNWKDENLAAAMSEYTGITDREIMLSDVYELKEIKLNENQCFKEFQKSGMFKYYVHRRKRYEGD